MAIEEVLFRNPKETKEDILFIGDMYETDVKGASNAGIEVAWINRENKEDEAHLAKYIVNGMKQLREVIDFRIS